MRTGTHAEGAPVSAPFTKLGNNGKLENTNTERRNASDPTKQSLNLTYITHNNGIAIGRP